MAAHPATVLPGLRQKQEHAMQRCEEPCLTEHMPRVETQYALRPTVPARCWDVVGDTQQQSLQVHSSLLLERQVLLHLQFPQQQGRGRGASHVSELRPQYALREPTSDGALWENTALRELRFIPWLKVA